MSCSFCRSKLPRANNKRERPSSPSPPLPTRSKKLHFSTLLSRLKLIAKRVMKTPKNLNEGTHSPCLVWLVCNLALLFVAVGKWGGIRGHEREECLHFYVGRICKAENSEKNVLSCPPLPSPPHHDRLIATYVRSICSH